MSEFQTNQVICSYDPTLFLLAQPDGPGRTSDQNDGRTVASTSDPVELKGVFLGSGRKSMRGTSKFDPELDGDQWG